MSSSVPLDNILQKLFEYFALNVIACNAEEALNLFQMISIRFPFVVKREEQELEEKKHEEIKALELTISGLSQEIDLLTTSLDKKKMELIHLKHKK